MDIMRYSQFLQVVITSVTDILTINFEILE